MSVGQQAPGTDERTSFRAPPGPPKTSLVPPGTRRTDPYTANRETDARRALTRGLAEYIEGLVVEQQDGREIRLQQVFDDWPEPEELSLYPSAVAYTPTPGAYEARTLAPVPTKAQQIPEPDGRYVMIPSDLSMQVRLEVWCTDTEERTTLAAALEDLFNPFTGAYGFTLELPHYHRMRARYEPLSPAYPDSEASAMTRERLVVFILSGQVPVVRLVAFPDANISARVTEVGPNVVVTGDDC